MKKVLVPGDTGILGFEDVKTWKLEQESDDFAFLSETVPQGNAARFALVKCSSTWVENFESFESNQWFIITANGQNPDDWTMNTKAPVTITDGKVDQTILQSGSVLAKFSVRKTGFYE